MLGQSLPCESSVKFTKVFPLVTNCFRKQILEVNWSEKKYGNSDFMKPSYRWGWQAQRGGQLSTVPQPRSGKSERSSQMSINWWVHSTQCKVKTASWRSMLQGESSWAEHWNLFSPHLSPGVSLIYDLAYDSGMLQSELFTSRKRNLFDKICTYRG